MATGSAFIARNEELRALRRAIEEVGAGRGGLVFVGGESGIGKTTLIHTALERHWPPDAAVGRGSSAARDSTPAFGPWREAVRSLFGRGGEWYQADALPPPFGHAPGHWSIYDLAETLTERWTRCSEPLVLVMEDMQWADPASLELFRFLAPRLSRVPVLVLATYRTDELDREHPLWTLLPEWCRQGAERLLLARMTPVEVEEMTRAWLGTERTDIGPIAQLIHGRSQGVALFARELLEQHRGSGALDPAHLPDTLLQALDSRLSRLKQSTRRILEPAAVIGERFPYDLLARVVGSGCDRALADGLSDAARYRILLRDPRGPESDSYRFDHGLVREAVLAAMSVSDRRRWHGQVAEAMEALGTFEADAISYHWTQAGDPRAIERGISAADRALELGAMVQAQNRYRTALAQAGEDHPRRAEILLKLGFSLRWASMQEAEQCFEAARRQAEHLGERATVVWSAHFLALAAQYRDDPRTLALMRAVWAEEQALLDDPDYRRIWQELLGQRGRLPPITPVYIIQLAMEGAFDEAEAELDAVDDHSAHAFGHEMDFAAVTVHWFRGRYRTAAVHAHRAATRAWVNRDYLDAVQMKYFELIAALLLDGSQVQRVDRLAAELAEWEQTARARAGHAYLPSGYSALGVYQYFRGDWQKARINLIEYASRAVAAAPGVVGFMALEWLLDIGDDRAAESIASDLAPRHPEDPGPFMALQASAHAIKARALLRRGHLSRARVWLDAAARHPSSKAGLIAACVGLAEAEYYRATGDLARARAEAERALEQATSVASDWFIVQAYRLLGELNAMAGDPTAALANFANGERIASSAGFSGAALLVRVRRLLAVANYPGRREEEESTRGELKRHGLGYLLPETPGPAVEWGLTAREIEVAALVSQGLTDKEVAQKLSISPKTVDRHLRHAFAKTGVTSRAGLTAKAVRMGWVDR